MERQALAALALAALAACAAPVERAREPAGYRWPSRAVVTLESTMGQTFTLVGATTRLDGEPVQECDAGEGRLEADRPFVAYDGSLPSGAHLLAVELRYRGNGHGIFSYLRGYRFDVRGEHRFEAPPDGLARIHGVAFERGEETTPLEDRPALRFETSGPELAGPAGCPAALPAEEK